MSLSFNPAAGLYNATGRYLDADFERLRLAGQARSNMSPQETRSLFEKDKALALQSAMDKVNEEYLYNWQMANKQQRDKDLARQREAIQNGFLYA